MIKFFRRIRQKLIKQGSFRKYLYYAIGEILLVVIGILIALQINTLSNQKKDRKLETQYFIRFKAELEENIKNIEDQINYSDRQILNYEIIVEALKNASVVTDSQQLYFALALLCKTYPVEYSNNVWIELLQNGQISIIRSEEFKDKLALLNSDLAQTLVLKKENKILNYEFARLTGEIFSIELRDTINHRIHPTRILNDEPIPNLPNAKEIINKLNRLDGLKGYLVDIKDSNRINKGKFQRHKKVLLELIEMCKKELKIDKKMEANNG